VRMGAQRPFGGIDPRVVAVSGVAGAYDPPVYAAQAPHAPERGTNLDSKQVDLNWFWLGQRRDVISTASLGSPYFGYVLSVGSSGISGVAARQGQLDLRVSW